MTDIPTHAKKVFQGKIFSVYQWQQEMYDGSQETFEALTRPGTIQILATLEGHVLLSHESQPNKPLSYTFLGGRQEENEDPLVTAKRELLEESGMISEDWELLKIFETHGKILWPTYLFVARNCKKIQEPRLDPGEKIEVVKVSFEKFLDIVCSQDFWGQNVANELLRTRLDPHKLEEFRKKLLINN